MAKDFYTIMLGSTGKYPVRYPSREKAEQAAGNLRLLGYETLVVEGGRWKR